MNGWPVSKRPCAALLGGSALHVGSDFKLVVRQNELGNRDKRDFTGRTVELNAKSTVADFGVWCYVDRVEQNVTSRTASRRGVHGSTAP